MIANPSKFHAIIIRKTEKNTEGIEININSKVLKTESEVPLLGIKLDNSLALIFILAIFVKRLQVN